MSTLHARFCMFGADLHAQAELINKISASELSQKFVKSALLVGKQRRIRSEGTERLWCVHRHDGPHPLPTTPHGGTCRG